MIFNLRTGYRPVTYLPATARALAAEIKATKERLAMLESAWELLDSPLAADVQIEIVIPEHEPKHARGWATGPAYRLGHVYREAVTRALERKGTAYLFLNLGVHSIAIDPTDIEDESHAQFSHHTERTNELHTVVWSTRDRGKFCLLPPASALC